MSQFSEYCNRLFEMEGINLYQFCSVHHLERSGIRRMLSGERMPKKELFEAFVGALTITSDEEKKLHEMYEREEIGVQRYENRIFAKKLLEYIGEQQTLPSQIKTQTQNMEMTERSVRAIQNRLEIWSLVRKILQMEEKVLYCNFPLEYPELLQILHEEFAEEGNTGKSFYHLFTAERRADISDDVNYNLKLMKHILPLSMQDRINYYPYYCYGNSMGKIQVSPYPWFLLSSEWLLLVSGDADTALLCSDRTAVDNYCGEIRKQLEKMKPLIFKAEQIGNALDFYIQTCVAEKMPLYSLEYYPCIVRAYTKEMFLDYARADILQDGAALIQAVEGLAGYSKQCRPYDAFLMMEGLEHFVQTGDLGPRYGTLLRPFSEEDRREILHRFEILCQEGQYRLHILPKGFFHPCPVIGMEIYDDQRITLMSFENMATFSSFGENTVYEAFWDYFESLLDRPEVSSVEETVQILREMQEKLS